MKTQKRLSKSSRRKTVRRRIRSGGSWRNPSSFRSRVLRRFQKTLLFVGFFITVLAIAIWGWRIEIVNVEGSTLVPNAVIKDAALVELAGYRWGIFPKNSVIIGVYRMIPAILQKKFSLLDTRGKLQGRNILIIKVREQKIAAIAYSNDGTSWLIGDGGDILFEASPDFRDSLLSSDSGVGILRFSLNVPGNAIGEDPLFTARQLKFLKEMWDQLQRASVDLMPEMIVPKYGAKNDFDIRTISGAVITTTSQGDTSYQLIKLQSVLKDKSTPSNSRASIRSIDLRYGDRVYIQ